ncbi:uncharacterized protein LOC128207036 [Mya arenaria]|uniref:uncharacterized protein LOC128204105 n=1 Tax=Mya arenaria TaxID=6604 RepID=UPI0022E1ED31|nr:uncharacterized protein LOC128204105 [Mya arenaria]XP_052765792.1 uncharacterized protein LOC128207036 [Mya arenaria]
MRVLLVCLGLALVLALAEGAAFQRTGKNTARTSLLAAKLASLRGFKRQGGPTGDSGQNGENGEGSVGVDGDGGSMGSSTEYEPAFSYYLWLDDLCRDFSMMRGYISKNLCPPPTSENSLTGALDVTYAKDICPRVIDLSDSFVERGLLKVEDETIWIAIDGFLQKHLDLFKCSLAHVGAGIRELFGGLDEEALDEEFFECSLKLENFSEEEKAFYEEVGELHKMVEDHFNDNQGENPDKKKLRSLLQTMLRNLEKRRR